MSQTQINQTEDIGINQNQNLNIGIVPSLITSIPNIPLDVSKDLSKYQKIFITKQADLFRMAHFCEGFYPEYLIWSETPEGDKKLIFTCSEHFECECCKRRLENPFLLYDLCLL